MTKKFVALLLGVSMIAASLTGCGAKESAAPESAAESAAETSVAESAAEDEASSDSETAAGDYSNVQIGLVLGVTIDDGGFTQAQYEGVVNAMTRLGMDPDTQLTYIENVSADNVQIESAVEELMEGGCNVIIGTSTSLETTMDKLAAEYTDVMFAQVGVPLEHCLTYHYRAYESMYAIGYMCGKLSESDTLGYIGGMSEASVRTGANGFALGAKAANPDAKVQLMWVGSWYDPAKEGECADTLYAAGINYIGTGTSSSGAPQAAQDKGAFTTCFDMDHQDFAPDSVLASFVFDWSPIFEEILKNYVEGGCKPYIDNYYWGIEQGCSQIAFNDKLVDADMQKEVLDILDQIRTGDVVVYSGELKDNEGNVLVNDGEVMDDLDVLNQEFLVENIIGSMK